ncbi:PH domain-containing protein [Actinobacteria bacterium YIM 96077]|uniref:PH domain-containing protein n=1 Tax=Phytoactinopolyspora halophila TaxID=1981511 RepID=A0A329QMP8_9ACTN|nr:PH domain-containing protein [Phytoactinopolyspora halophila]AYY14400.1 PH domain-containing protein [Actinobacteria bacterium YIM 96077]RAW11878.1 PH domain-containing protein [Phytoactinopolyspora halophila]
MRFPEKLLSEGESVEFHLRTHAKALITPIVVLIVTGAAAGFGLGILPDDDGTGVTVGRWVIIGAAVLVVLIWSLWPFLTWLTTTYTVTNVRLITRTGVISRTGRNIPLRRINDAAFEQRLIDRILRCGTLIVSAASEEGQIKLYDVPRVHHVQLRLSELVGEAHDEGWVRDDEGPEENDDQ